MAWLLATKKNDLESAFIYAQNAKAKAPKDPAVLDTVGWILTLKKQYMLALPNFRLALKAVPHQPSILYHEAVALKGLHKDKEAIEALKEALNYGKNFPERKYAQKLLKELEKK